MAGAKGATMKITISVIKADIGSIGGHIAPSQPLLAAVGAHIGANA
ncbi:MAG: fructose 1,6-bisphosphatase, partial [Burkholderiaceae bacterium]